MDAVMELHRRKYTELLERYKIREGTCASALLGKIVSFVPFEGDDDELLPYSSLLSDEKFEVAKKHYKEKYKKIERFRCCSIKILE